MPERGFELATFDHKNDAVTARPQLVKEPLFIAQSVPLPAITRRKESNDVPFPHFANFILVSLLRSSSLQQIFAVRGIFYVRDAISLGKLMFKIHE